MKPDLYIKAVLTVIALEFVLSGRIPISVLAQADRNSSQQQRSQPRGTIGSAPMHVIVDNFPLTVQPVQQHVIVDGLDPLKYGPEGLPVSISGAPMSGAQPLTQLTQPVRWEYTEKGCNIDGHGVDLDNLGSEGWEAYAVVGQNNLHFDFSIRGGAGNGNIGVPSDAQRPPCLVLLKRRLH